jgi:type II secretory pathway predicted ATPase ExeA
MAITQPNRNRTKTRTLWPQPEFVSYFGLDDQPFLTSPNPAYAWTTPSMREGLRLMRDVAFSRNGLGIISGVVGVGKTTLMYLLNSDLGTRGAKVAMFENVPGNERQTAASILRDVAMKLGLTKQPRGNSADGYYREIYEYAEQVDADGSTILVLIDEAHELSRTGVRAIKDLLGMQTMKGQLIQVMLFGQNPLMLDALRSDRALHTRLAQHKELDVFDLSQVGPMLNFRMGVAGRKDELFTESAVDAIAHRSGGNPRIVCRIAHAACEMACFEKAKMVSVEHVERVDLRHDELLL